MTAYYNEIEPYAADWLENLIRAGHIAPGDVDRRSIVDVQPDDLKGYTQCHFFAGIGGWSYALRLAGWPDDRPVWTGSCPCQPFSVAGKGKAFEDDRHLWPEWNRLIGECRPSVVFGEQVAQAINWGWLDLVQSDLEGQGYACGSAVLPACGVGAPHIRQRCWFMANAYGGDASTEGLQRGGQHGFVPEDGRVGRLVNSASEQVGIPGRSREPRGADSRMANSGYKHAGWTAEPGETESRRPLSYVAGCSDGSMADAGRIGRQDGRVGENGMAGIQRQQGDSTERPRSSPWADIQLLPCTDGKTRPTKSGIFPLAHGIPARVGKLRAAGNAIVPQVAAEFIKAASGS